MHLGRIAHVQFALASLEEIVVNGGDVAEQFTDAALVSDLGASAPANATRVFAAELRVPLDLGPLVLQARDRALHGLDSPWHCSARAFGSLRRCATVFTPMSAPVRPCPLVFVQVRVDGLLLDSLIVVHVVPVVCTDPKKEPTTDGHCHCLPECVINWPTTLTTPAGSTLPCLLRHCLDSCVRPVLSRFMERPSGECDPQPTAQEPALGVILPAAILPSVVLACVAGFGASALRGLRSRLARVPPLRTIPQGQLDFGSGETDGSCAGASDFGAVDVAPGGLATATASSLLADAPAVDAADAFADGAEAVAAALPWEFGGLSRVTLAGRQARDVVGEPASGVGSLHETAATETTLSNV